MNLEYPLNDNYFAFRHVEIIKCKEPKLILVGWNSCETEFHALVIPRLKSSEELRPLQDLVEEVGPCETHDQIKREIEVQTGIFHEKEAIYAQALLGFHRFLQGYYLMYVGSSQPIAKIGRHKIYEIKATEVIQLFDFRNDGQLDNEKKYFEELQKYKLQNYYYSPTYDLTNSLAKNMVRNALPLFGIQNAKAPRISLFSRTQQYQGICEIFQYNYRMIQQLHPAVNCKKWIVAIIHGYCKHINVKLKGTIFNVVVVARRSRHHAGTRYIKRGISKDGFAANFVQVEQIVINYSSSQDTRPVCSSFVQVRGSVPTYWMQKPSIAIPKPAIELRSSVDYMYVGTRKHFHDMVGRYGKLIYCINLMKMKQKNPRESELSRDYQTAMAFINKNDLKDQHAIHYVEIDMKYNLKLDKKLFINKIRTLAYFAMQRTGIFLCMNHSTSSHEQYVEFQNGVIRANCVDCLDRTNSFQQLVGQTLLAVQLNRLIGEDIKFDSLELDDTILQLYSALYEQMGDLISIQYGSSLAHKQKIQKTTESRFELFTSFQRHWNNNFKDEDRQRQLDVFLGYKPDPLSPPLWKTKPPIQHFPDEHTYLFEKMPRGEWYKRAIAYFQQDYFIHDFQRISRKDLGDVSLPKMERLGKQYLINKFNAEIVSNLINEKEDTTVLHFFLMPKLIMEKRVWKEMNPRSKTVRTLNEQLALCYNHMDFLKAEEMPGGHMAPLKLKETKDQRKAKGRQAMNFQEDGEFLRDLQKMVNAQLMDQQEMQLLQDYIRGENIKDEQIEKSVSDLFTLINQDILSQDFMIGNCVMEEDMLKQLKRVEANINGRNFIGNGEEASQQVAYKLHSFIPELSLKSVQPRKKQIVKENKVKMLEQIMTKNFSHGNIDKITQV